MAEIIRFPNSGRIPATSIPRAEFERLAELALDVVDQIVALLSKADDGCDSEGSREAGSPSMAPAGELPQQPATAWSHNNPESW